MNELKESCKLNLQDQNSDTQSSVQFKTYKYQEVLCENKQKYKKLLVN